MGGSLLNSFLHAQFVIQEVVGELGGSEIDAIDANAVAIAIGADQADMKVRGRCFSNSSFADRGFCLIDHHLV